eukprot:1649879-Prymnesium_polylepis.1
MRRQGWLGPDLKKWPSNIYSQIAIALKGGELRETARRGPGQLGGQARSARATSSSRGQAAARVCSPSCSR